MPKGSPRSHHWDLMLENNGHLETWSLPAEPTKENTLQATHLAPHRMDYLHYQGPVSNNRGQVTRVISGQFNGEIFPDSSPQEFDLRLFFGDEQLCASFTQVDGENWDIRFSDCG